MGARESTRAAAALPSLDVSIAELLQVIGSSDATAADVSRVMSRDVALTARVLKVVNSAYYGRPRAISSIDRAVVVLGFPSVRSVAMAASCCRMRRGAGEPAVAVLLHCFGVAVCARQLANLRPGLCREKAFMAGLLHDFGLLLELHSDPEVFKALPGSLAGVKTEPAAWLALERSLYGADHAEAAAQVFEQWQFPADVVTAIRHHHDPLGLPESERDLAAVVALADSLVADAGIGLACDTLTHHPGEELLYWLQFDWDLRGEVQTHAGEDLQVFRRMLDDES